jgi:hypothetical protein
MLEGWVILSPTDERIGSAAPTAEYNSPMRSEDDGDDRFSNLHHSNGTSRTEHKIKENILKTKIAPGFKDID